VRCGPCPQCVFESGVSQIVQAQLMEAEQQRGSLPSRYEHAQKCRPKLVELMGGEAPIREPTLAIPELLEQTLQQIDSSRFSFGSDRKLVRSLLLHLDWLIKTAVEQAKLDPLHHAIDPRRLHAIRAPNAIQPSPLRTFMHTVVRLVEKRLHAVSRRHHLRFGSSASDGIHFDDYSTQSSSTQSKPIRQSA